MKYDIAVIGGGPAGCMAAVAAGRSGRSVILLEANEKIGRKLLITGKGRCNLTNDSAPDNIIKNTIRNPRFLFSSVNSFPPAELMSFFESEGVALKTERGNRVFPVSDKSADIVDALFRATKKSARILFSCKVKTVNKVNDEFCITSESGETVLADSVIIATGGKSYPTTGSTGDGYRLAEHFGHRIVPPAPSLVPIVCEDKDVPNLQGLTLKNVTLSLFERGKNKAVYKEQGEMLFTHFGISGPLTLSASCHIIKDPSDYFISVDMKSALSKDELDSRLLKDFELYKNKNFSNALDDLLPSKMIPVVIARSGIPPETKVNSITKAQREVLLDVIKNFTVEISSLGRTEEAVVTRGGVDVREINPNSMESKLTEGLYFAGEVIDCDAYTGGYNLQIAFSTGFAAGTHAADRFKE